MDLPKHRKYSLKSKLDCIDLFKNGMSLQEICKVHNIKIFTLQYWLKMEKKLRKEYVNTMELNQLKSKINSSHDIIKCDIIINRIENISTLLKKNNIKVVDKIKCLDLMKKYKSTTTVSEKTGFNKQLISQWVIDERYIRERYKLLLKKRNNFKLNEKLNCNNEDQELEKLTTEQATSFDQIDFRDCIARKLSLEVKKNVLNWYDKGVSIHEITKSLNLELATVFYWTSNSVKLRSKIMEFESCIMSGGTPKPQWSAKYKEVKQRKRLDKQLKAEAKQIHFTSYETKLTTILWQQLLGMCSHEVIGDIFSYSRHSIRSWGLSLSDIMSKYETRQKWRQLRLEKLLTNTDHRIEIRKLYKLFKSDAPLKMLDSYITYGMTYKCPMYSVKKYKVSYKQKKVKEILRPIVEKKDSLIASSISNELQSLFEELYRNEYQILYMINERYFLLIDQLEVCEDNHKHVVKEEIATLNSHLLKSLEKLISLHHMMIVPY